MAARHLGRTDVELPWPTDPSFLAMRRPVRQTYLAHVVQAAADASANNLEQTVSKARACVPTLRDCFDADLKVLGAIARARSSQRRYDDALELTTDIVPAWIGIGRADGASYVLCEHLRVLGILDRKRELAGELLAEWLSAVDSDLRTNDVSRAFIWVELARAHVNAGQLERAREAIERPTEAIPEHLRWLRLRTLARLLDAEGRAREADDRRVLLRERAKGEQAYQQRLADLDAALRDDGDLVPVLSALRANPPQKMAGLWEDGLSAREQAQRLAREYPY